ncbi:MAG: YheV family putative metal-binding protein [Saccharospirillaceae bacterium]|nr:YheV family putative metal-binding protein [Pseudomonadales bacterium]NRB78988.1 YheV family putative metal-binding protein [Saccharospirillaceae bacterium]
MIKRFIAGAVCPKCGNSDSIKAFRDEEKSLMLRECVDCGFEDALSTIVNQTSELDTRVNIKESHKDVPSEPIKFDPNSIS